METGGGDGSKTESVTRKEQALVSLAPDFSDKEESNSASTRSPKLRN